MTQEVKRVRKRRLQRVPTLRDLEDYGGGHTFRLWAALPPDWRCPACRRSRFELLTWTKSITGYGVPRGEYQWLAPLHEHHDHRSDHGMFAPRFSPTVICSDCNHADGRAKRQLGLPGRFSFSPIELSQFITGYPHNGVDVDVEAAGRVYDSLTLFLLPQRAVRDR